MLVLCAIVNEEVVHQRATERALWQHTLNCVTEDLVHSIRTLAQLNKKDIETYFPSAILRYVVKQPLQLLEAEGKYDIKANLDGGGFTGQSQALRLAIARALVKIDANDKKALKDAGFMTRDSRAVERKKPGQPKARRRFQFSKR